MIKIDIKSITEINEYSFSNYKIKSSKIKPSTNLTIIF